MRKFLIFGLLATTTLIAPLCFAAEQTREVPEFKTISSQGAYRLVINVGQKQSVIVTADDAELARVVTKVIGDELVISMPDTKNYKASDKIKISIRVAHLEKFTLEGVGSTTLNNISGERFEVNYQGVGNLIANGKVKQFVLNAEGVGSLNARELEAEHVDVKLEGVGSAKVRATESLLARVEGIGSLTYYGRPARVAKTVDGIGSVRAGE